MVEKLILSEEDYDYLAKGIILGTILGILIGIFINNIVFGFSICTTIGLTLSILWSIYRKFKPKKGTD